MPVPTSWYAEAGAKKAAKQTMIALRIFTGIVARTAVCVGKVLS